MNLGDLFGSFDGDQLAELVDLITKNKGSLEALGKLPDYLEKIASALGEAGDQAKSAGFALVGDDGESGMRATLTASAEALSDITESLGKGIARIADAAESLGKVPLMDGPASRLMGATEEMGNTTVRLAELAKAMDTIGDTLGKVGSALAKLGEHLDESGGHARGFADLA
jgi:hypothetical protein